MSITVALVDERILFRKAIKELLLSFGEIKVEIEADNEKDLIAKRTSAVHIELCILCPSSFMIKDFRKAREIKASFKGIKILAIAPYYDRSIVARMINEGFNGLVSTYSEPKQLKKAVFQVCTKGTYWPKFFKQVLRQSSNETEYSLIKLSLSEKYLDFLELCLTDLTYTEIGERMGLSERTVEGFRDHLFRRFNVKSKTALVLFALKTGIIELI